MEMSNFYTAIDDKIEDTNWSFIWWNHKNFYLMLLRPIQFNGCRDNHLIYFTSYTHSHTYSLFYTVNLYMSSVNFYRVFKELNKSDKKSNDRYHLKIY